MKRLLLLGAILASCNGLHFGYNNRQSVVQESPEVITKSFYFFAAPDDEDFRPRPAKPVITTEKKKLEVVVIKAPEYNSFTNTAINLVKKGQETKTIVYVLSKQPDTEELVRTIQQAHKSHKPEVRFIKYNTPEDAKRFQDASRFDFSSGQPNSLEPVNVGATVSDNSDAASPSFDPLSYDDDDLFTARHPPFLPTGVDVVPGSSYLPPKRDFRRH